MDIAERITLGPYCASICVFAALLESCGNLSLGSYGTVTEGGAAGSAVGAGGPHGTSGYGN
ncbi:MAG TPA: hypothetical protein VJV79_31745, partial [Polyangiaceae bacterium]|nr:hypothetical protein [Polyangiaceae bacterium]